MNLCATCYDALGAPTRGNTEGGQTRGSKPRLSFEGMTARGAQRARVTIAGVDGVFATEIMGAKKRLEKKGPSTPGEAGMHSAKKARKRGETGGIPVEYFCCLSLARNRGKGRTRGETGRERGQAGGNHGSALSGTAPEALPMPCFDQKILSTTATHLTHINPNTGGGGGVFMYRDYFARENFARGGISLPVEMPQLPTAPCTPQRAVQSQLLNVFSTSQKAMETCFRIFPCFLSFPSFTSPLGFPPISPGFSWPQVSSILNTINPCHCHHRKRAVFGRDVQNRRGRSDPANLKAEVSTLPQLLLKTATVVGGSIKSFAACSGRQSGPPTSLSTA